MTVISNFIPILGCFLDGFGTWIPAFVALGVIFYIPRFLREVVSFV